MVDFLIKEERFFKISQSLKANQQSSSDKSSSTVIIRVPKTLLESQGEQSTIFLPSLLAAASENQSVGKKKKKKKSGEIWFCLCVRHVLVAPYRQVTRKHEACPISDDIRASVSTPELFWRHRAQCTDWHDLSWSWRRKGQQQAAAPVWVRCSGWPSGSIASSAVAIVSAKTTLH